MLAASTNFATLVGGNEYYGAWRVEMTLPIARTNLCSNPLTGPSTTGWSAAGTPAPTIASTVVLLPHTGTNTLLITSTGPASFFPSVTFTLATTPGLTYIASVWVWVPTGTPNVGLYLAGRQFGEMTTVRNQWARLLMKFTANSASSTIGVLCGFTATNQRFYVNDVLMVQQSYLEDDVTFAVKSVEIDASTTTDMPQGSRLQVGYPAMEATFTLAGQIDPNDESKNAAWLFGRYSTTSPLYHQDVSGCAVTIDLGLYTDTAAGLPELLRKFTGEVDDYQVNDDGSVVFTCVEKTRAALRSVPAMPAVITAPPFNAALTSEFAVDHLLRAASNAAISTWPALRSGCVLAAGCRSSAWPEVGTVVDASGADFMPGVFGSAFTGNNATWSFTSTTANSTRAEFWVQGLTASASADVTVGNNDLVSEDWWSLQPIGLTNWQLILWSKAAGSSTFANFTNPAPDSGQHYIAIEVTWTQGGTAYSAQLTIDANNYTISGTTTGNRTTGYSRAQISSSDQDSSIEALQVTTEDNTAPSNYGFVPQAVLNPSLNTLIAVPALDAGDPYAVIQQIADAELAVAGGDESGIFRFYNRDMLRAASSARDVTSSTSLTAIGSQDTTAASVVNHATVEYAPWSFASTRSTVWSATTPQRVRKFSTRTITAKSDGLFANIDTTLTNLPNGSGDTANSHYRASTNKAGTNEHPGGLKFVVTQQDPETLLITVTNPTAQDAWFVSPANYVDIPVGTPLLRIAALVVTQGDPLVADFQYPPLPAGAASTRFGDVTAAISGNPWIQDDDTALQLATDIVVDQCVPRPDLTGIAMVPDPRIQLTDVVHILDPDNTLVDEYARVFGWTISWAAGDSNSPMTYDMTLDARTIAAPGGWIMGVPGRSEVGSTTYVYSGA